jgi:phospholipid/cholesterol/gamma-HCH transport system substrate-binding protein
MLTAAGISEINQLCRKVIYRGGERGRTVNRNRNDVFAQVVVGFFMLVVTGLLGYFTIVVSGVDILRGEGRQTITVVFDQVGGLKEHDNVMYRGTKVGSVERVSVTPSNLVVRAYIDRAVTLRRSYRIAVCNLSMLGGNYLLLEEGTGSELDLGNTVLRGETPTDWMQDVSNIAKNLRELTSRKEITGIVTNLEALSIKANKIAARLERGEGTLGKLLGPDESLYHQTRMAVTNAVKLMENLNVAAEKIKNGEGTVGKLLSEDKLYRDLESAVESFRATCRSFDGTATIESANKLLDNLNIVAQRLKDGKGTMGKLLADETMYNEVNGLIKDVRQVLDNYRDTTPITTFSSLATGAL